MKPSWISVPGEINEIPQVLMFVALIKKMPG
jgi:hypothetical protein